jgi:hypothetical protein
MLGRRFNGRHHVQRIHVVQEGLFIGGASISK